MRYLTLSKSGQWYFRYQLPPHHRHFFDDRLEIKRSLKTSCKQQAQILALELELSIRKKVSEDHTTQADFTRLSITTSKTNKASCPYTALENFYQYKLDHVAKKTADSLKAQCTILLNLINKTCIKHIRRGEAEAVKQKLKQYPTNLKKHREFNDLDVVQAIELNIKLKKPMLSEESVKDYIQKASSFFEWCVLNEITDINPFKGIRFRKSVKDSEAKNAYSQKDLERIFTQPIFTCLEFKHPHYYWLPLLAVLTGARLNELCQLYADNIVKVDNVWCLSIEASRKDQKLKNAQSKRLIPIHHHLINLGFVDYVHSLNINSRLFPELKISRDGYGSAPSKWYGRFKTKLGFNKGHDFHSFRHTVANELKNSLVEMEVASSLLGHLLNNITYDRYGKGHNLNILKKAVEKLPTSNLNNITPFKTCIHVERKP